MAPPLDGRPRTRQRVHKPPSTLIVPDIEEDAAERKRVLNVLAQRRYRQRKREARLGAQALARSSTRAPEASQLGMSSRLGEGNAAVEPVAGLEVTNQGDSPLVPLEDIQLQSRNRVIGPFDTVQPNQAPLPWLAGSADGLSHSADPSTSALSLSPTDEADSLSLLTDLFSIPFNTPPYTNPSAPASPPPSTNTDVPPSSDGTVTTTAINSCPSPSPDSYLLPVPPLTLLRGLLRIASRLNAVSSVWSLAAASPFTLGLAPNPADLPAAWQPTPTQLLVPHHPVLDLLPWPGVRDRLIEFMNLRLELDVDEGGGGGGAMAAVGGEGLGASLTGLQLVDFVYDMEDGAEGLRIWGSDPYDEGCWEVGQVVFERWWFVFDKAVVERSNQWRRQRGAPPLRALGWR
ncbi:hypothetical protein VTI74DRAFT_6674 [Chaetomium olivicolor]